MAATQASSPVQSRGAKLLSSIQSYIALIFTSRIATIGLAIVLFWVVVGLISLVWTPVDPNASDFRPNQPMSAENWLGTDRLGRDNLSRVMAGTQVILLKTRVPALPLSGYFTGLAGLIGIILIIRAIPMLEEPNQRLKGWGNLIVGIALIPVVIFLNGLLGLQAIVLPNFVLPLGVALWGVIGSLSLGTVLGLLAGYKGGWYDQIIMQILDALIAFPRIVLYLVVITALGQGDLIMIFAIAVTGAPGVARLARSQALDIKTRDYIRAAETRGESIWFIMFREIWPNAIGPLLVDSMLRVGYAIFTIGTLGFLGRGLPPPEPDWGNMINVARPSFGTVPVSVLAPAVAIGSLVVGLNLFVDGLNEEITRYQK